jgi:hypothetical protein
MGVSIRKWGSQFRFVEVEPSFKEFLASPAMMHLGLLSIKPDVGCTKFLPDCYFYELCHSDFLDLSCLVLYSYLPNE